MHDTGCLGLVHWGNPEGWYGRREEGSGWGTCVCLWRIHFDIWQNQYNIVKLKNKIKFKKKMSFQRERRESRCKEPQGPQILGNVLREPVPRAQLGPIILYQESCSLGPILFSADHSRTTVMHWAVK